MSFLWCQSCLPHGITHVKGSCACILLFTTSNTCTLSYHHQSMTHLPLLRVRSWNILCAVFLIFFYIYFLTKTLRGIIRKTDKTCCQHPGCAFQRVLADIWWRQYQLIQKCKLNPFAFYQWINAVPSRISWANPNQHPLTLKLLFTINIKCINNDKWVDFHFVRACMAFFCDTSCHCDVTVESPCT